MSQEKIKTGSCSIIGDRTSQQDAFRMLQKKDTLLAVVCDGMGGMAGGEKASQLTVHTIVDSFQAVQELKEEQFAQWMYDAFTEADRVVSSLTDEQGNALRAGTTVVAVLIKENRMYWGSVGDSRIYYLRNSGIQSVTRMHNYNLRLNEMVAAGEITREMAEQEGGRGEALISFIGAGGPPIIDIGSVPVVMETGDVVILSSDGLYKSLEDQQVQAIIEESGENMQIAAQRLCKEALRLSNCKQDNTTVIAVMCCS